MLMASMRLLPHVVCPRFAPELVFAAIETHSVRNVLLVPTMIQVLADDPRRGAYRLQSLKDIIYGASPISEAVLDRAMACFPGVRFTQAYGQTEMSTEIGRESCRERVCQSVLISVVDVSLKTKNNIDH